MFTYAGSYPGRFATEVAPVKSVIDAALAAAHLTGWQTSDSSPIRLEFEITEFSASISVRLSHFSDRFMDRPFRCKESLLTMPGCETVASNKEAPVALVPSFLDLLQPLSAAMTAPTFDSFLTILTGWVFARRRTVTGMILAADATAAGAKHHSAYHRVFAAARWSLDELGLAVLGLALALAGDGPAMLAVDDTLARKRGKHVFGVGMHHDPLISSRGTTVTSWGHCWVVLGVVVRPPCCGGRWFCLPVLFRLYVPKGVATAKRLAYRTKPELAVEMLAAACGGRFAGRRFHAVGDTAYGGKGVLTRLPANCDLTSRLAMDARLHAAPPARVAGRPGRPRVRGDRLPTPTAMLAGRCRRLTLDVYGRRDRSRVAEAVGRAYAAPGRPLKVVAVEPLTGGRKPQAFYSTRVADTAGQVLTRYAARWSIEVANHDAKGQLGFEQPQGWTRPSVARTAPVAMLLYSLVVLWFAAGGHRHYAPPARPWYAGKAQPSFADMLATLRCQSVRAGVLTLGLHGTGSRKVVRTLLHVVKQAA
ncbi:transposase [Sphingomonas sp.]|uniref:IS701 family transposase n=1 Tax=Sphingomonas sp. TaxID=28214 RepID=UPI003AFF891F